MVATPATFRAYSYEHFGDVTEQVKLRTDIPQDTLKADQICIQVHAAALNPIDYKLIEWGTRMQSVPPTPERPFRVGFDFAGIVAEVGSEVTDLKVGDEVLGMGEFPKNGTFAEHITIGTNHVVRKPSKLNFHQAAGLALTGQTSYQALTAQGQLQKGQRVLILGGSSATGMLAIQIAKALGASFVAATTSTRNIEFVQAFGADRVIDYTTEKWSDVLDANSIDLIYDCGVEAGAWDEGAQRVLKAETGRLVTIGDDMSPSESPIGATYVCFCTHPNNSDLAVLTELVENDQLHVPIDSVFAFEDLLDAFKTLKTGRSRGKIILDVVSSQP
ncbi:hypothetical protein Poli38472_012946 [Pythium oligandrum]|uniref:Enoyl reductase (ER) domain-containing protein n=1 Tax=Pythium oligandrum TaxID=41045 RepID=A0A8K1CJQ6_PYTOL|nr:hypothetical protein Poli38472_012946 [Pythium oligandrum]|eukprot:TMW64324.1 hypothetical protein Poli38472_012946 [Pythium oligandrum]